MNIGRSARGMSRDISLAEKQARAFGTTLRYAFAGSVIFGMTTMVGKLNELQQQMGLIAAIAGPAGVNLKGGALSQLQDELAMKSVNARTNINDLNASVINYLSTVQGADPKELPQIVSSIGMAARLSQTPTEDLTKAVTTLNIAAGRPNNLRTINALLREWFSLVSRAPGGIAAAPQIAQQLGPLASVAQMGRLTPEQLFGFSLGALRFGATPSVALRGTQFFLQSLFRSPSEQGREEMRRAGLTPDLLQQVGGTEFARRYLKHVQALGATPSRAGVKRFGALADVMPNPEALVGEEFAPNVNIPGLSPKAIEFLSKTLGRIHGIRTALVLLQQLNAKGDVASLDELFKSFEDLRRNVGPGAKQLQNAADKYRAETPLQAAAIALDSLRTTISRDLGFFLDPASRGISRAAQHLVENENTRKAIAVGGGAFLTAMVGSRLLGGGFSLAKLRGMGGQGVVAAQAASAISRGVVGLGETPLNPLYVTVVGQIFGGNRNDPGGGLPPVITGGGRGMRGRIGRGLGRFGRGAAVLTGSWWVASLLADQMGWDSFIGPGEVFNMKNLRQSPLGRFLGRGGLDLDEIKRRQGLERMSMKFPYLFRAVRDQEKLDPFQREVVDKFLQGGLSRAAAEKKLDRMALKRGFETNDKMRAGLDGRSLGSIDGQIDLNVKISDNDSVILQKQIPIPIPEWFKGGKGPVSRGRRNTVRLDFEPGIKRR